MKCICRQSSLLSLTALAASLAAVSARSAEPDLIFHHGKIVTVDRDFAIHEALAIEGNRIARTGSNAEVLAARGPKTKVIDLQGKMALPGLMDSHVHSLDACMMEFDHPIPHMESIADVLAYIRSRAEALGEGKWVRVRQVFITRLREQRYPTRPELDEAAPRNPVAFSTGPDDMLNSLAMKECGIDKELKVPGPGFIERDPATGEPTGLLRNLKRLIKAPWSDGQPTEAERQDLALELFADYNSVGLTSVCDRSVSESELNQYRQMAANNLLTVRVAISASVDASGRTDEVQKKIRDIAADPLRNGGPMCRIIGIKTFLDGGMLTGSAYMRQPWGVSEIYSITDPMYRGVLFIPPQQLLPIVRTAVEEGLQFTAHSVGDGAVHNLLDAYEEVNRSLPIQDSRPCITHSNFMSREAVEKAAKLGVAVDIQPAWLYLDARTLTAQFGYDRLRYFQPLKSIFEAGGIAGGGSDHMQKIGSLRSINPYNPFLGMWTTMARQGRWFEGSLHPEEALSREQAIRFYTINNAKLMFLDDETGSLEAGKLADLIILDRDLLDCPLDDVRDAKVLATYLDGKLVYEAK